MRLIRGLEAAKSNLSELLRVGPDGAMADGEHEGKVREILVDVRARGDQALLDCTRRIDGVELGHLEVSAEEIAQSRGKASGDLVEALGFAAERIRSFHIGQKQRMGLEFEEGGLGFVVRPVERVGIYVPGGKASYPSTVLMTAIPARVAGVSELVLTTPPAPDGTVPVSILAAADIAGVDRVFNIGGAQAIGAMACGTESVPKVDKICGPGNIYVTLAKKQVYGMVAIDGLHGPTETVIIADESANRELCAADLLAQAEHDEMATAILITTSLALAEEIGGEIEFQLSGLERSAIARESLDRNGAVIVVTDLDEAIELANLLAPEHLCLAVKNARSYVDRIRHAGGIFVGAPETVGDYVAGPSHVMPTGGTARFGSPLSVLDFLKLSILVDLDDDALRALGPASAAMARAEGLTAHALSVERRLASSQEAGQ